VTARARATLVCFIAGVALAVAVTVGTTRLVLAGRGFLVATGLLVALALAAVAAGAWGGAPELTGRADARRRTLALAITLLVAAGYLLRARTAVPDEGISGSGALAAMLLLAAPGYAAGALFVALAQWERALAPAALFGTACGVLLTAGLLVPYVQPWAALLAAGTLAAAAVPLAPRATAHSDTEAAMHERVVIVTGVSVRGQLGFAIAHRLRTAGARLVVSGSRAAVHELAAELGPADAVVPVQADLAGDEGPAAIVAAAQQHFGRVDGLVNVAGGLSVIATVEQTTPAQWTRELQRNAETAFRMSRAALPLLRTSRGAIVNFASPAAFRAPASLAAYSAGKAAVVALTRSLAAEERAHGVRANAIAPGMIDTAQNREGASDDARYVTRDEITEVVLFLLSPAASGVTGETIHVLGQTIA
jgi:NAD(P)-dependent dehydrogenase (short-subunit alcohol dehydrogenase family)